MVESLAKSGSGGSAFALQETVWRTLSPELWKGREGESIVEMCCGVDAEVGMAMAPLATVEGIHLRSSLQ